ncbi:MAG: hypothetical protein U9N59_14455 [Campylobacterota bacterium]|nr:hypothetical protein [Campylobacterota bacterium]
MIIELKNYTLLSDNEQLKLLKIRNSKGVRESSKNTDIIEINDHLNWIEKLKTDTSKIYYAVIVDSVLVGGINVVDINTDKIPFWGLFFACTIQPLISSLVTYAFLDRLFSTLNIDILNSEVNVLNVNAYRFSINFGLTVYKKFTDADVEYYTMHISKETWNKNKTANFPKMIGKRVNKIEFKFNN